MILRHAADNWKWTNGQEAQFTAWATGEPCGKYECDFELCAEIYKLDTVDNKGGKWNDATCERKKNCFICMAHEGKAYSHTTATFGSCHHRPFSQYDVKRET